MDSKKVYKYGLCNQNWKKKTILNLKWSVALWTDLILGVARVVHQVTQAVKHDLVAPTKLPVQNCNVKSESKGLKKKQKKTQVKQIFGSQPSLHASKCRS